MTKPSAKRGAATEPNPAMTTSTNRETIAVAVGPNVDGHAHQAIAAQTPAQPEE
jgi:hypothetical protein